MINPNYEISFSIINSNDIEKYSELILSKLSEFFKSNISLQLIKNINSHNFDLTRKSILNYQGYLYLNKNNIIIYLDNTGEAYYSLIYNISLLSKDEIIHCQMTNDDDQFPGYILHYFNMGIEKRVIQCYNDNPQWVFYSIGEVQTFENIKYYKNKIVRNRFNRNIIYEYFDKLNFKINENEFWMPQNNIIEFIRN